jgi:hypothetical protein
MKNCPRADMKVPISYIGIGVGETFAAIDALLTAIARDQIAVSNDLVVTVTAWLDCFIGQAAEPRLRELLADVENQPAPTDIDMRGSRRDGYS